MYLLPLQASITRLVIFLEGGVNAVGQAELRWIINNEMKARAMQILDSAHVARGHFLAENRVTEWNVGNLATLCAQCGTMCPRRMRVAYHTKAFLTTGVWNLVTFKVWAPEIGGGGISRKSDILLKTPLEPNLKKGRVWGRGGGG